MAKVSRSSKKQPAFDPSELEDLIFSPAVGKGVGSHLVSRSHVTTVVRPLVPTVASKDVTPVTPNPEPGDWQEPPTSARTRVDIADLTTVVTTHLPTGIESVPPTVTGLLPSQTDPEKKLWITENGDLVPEARVKRIRLAQDVINSAEECVYDTLWNAKLIQTDERQSCRIVQAGYDYLVKRSRLSRKTIQRIIAKLLEKDFIAVEMRADIYQRTSTIYRVLSYRAVLEKHVQKGRLYVAKMGPGFSYAQPLDQDRATPTLPRAAAPEGTMDRYDLTSIANMTTVANETTVTMVKMDRPTVVKMSPYLLDSLVLDNTSSSPNSAIRDALAVYGAVDDDVVKNLALACRIAAPNATEAEIVHFIHEKGRYAQKKESRVHSPIGFLVTAVPKCFSGETLESYRRQKKKSVEVSAERDSEEQAAMELWRREQEASLLDPAVSEQEKHLIRLCLGLNTG
jgi:predicted transcriptional regulator